MKDVAIGIDIGGTNSVFGFVDREGSCLEKGSISTAAHPQIDDYIKAMVKAIDKTKASLKEEVNIIGMGIGAPNGNFYSGTIEYAPNLAWEGIVPLAELFKKHYDMPVFLTNDANAAAIGEMVYGGAKGMKNFLMITLGTGLGSGIVVNGELVYGHDGFAGEIGHTIAIDGGRMCGCGRRGCLETYASATGIRRTVMELLADRIDESSLRDVSHNDLTAKMISDAANEGDIIAHEAFEITGDILGTTLCDSVAYTSPEAIFLFGGLSNAGDLIFEPTKKHMEENMLEIFKNKVKILPSQLPDNVAAILGSSALVWKETGK